MFIHSTVLKIWRIINDLWNSHGTYQSHSVAKELQDTTRRESQPYPSPETFP